MPKEITERARWRIFNLPPDERRLVDNKAVLHDVLDEFPAKTLKDMVSEKVEFVQIWWTVPHEDGFPAGTFHVPYALRGRLRLSALRNEWRDSHPNNKNLNYSEAARAFGKWLESEHKFVKLEVFDFHF